MTANAQWGSWCRATDSSAFTLEGEVEDVLRGYSGDITDEEIAAVAVAYRAAINAALPEGVALCGNEFYGPADAERPDLRAIVDTVDFWAVAEEVLDPPRYLIYICATLFLHILLLKGHHHEHYHHHHHDLPV